MPSRGTPQNDQEDDLIHEPRPDDDALDESFPAFKKRLLEHLHLSLEEEQRELDCWNEEVDEAERTGDCRSTARQCETIRQGCALLLGTTAEIVMRTCREGPDIDAEKDAKHIRRIHNARAWGAPTRTPAHPRSLVAVADRHAARVAVS